MCIENGKCLNMFSMQVGFYLICLSTVPEAALYILLE